MDGQNIELDVDGFAAAYLDDVVIHSIDWEEHVCYILKKLQHAGLPVKLSKFQFAMAWCSYIIIYVGHVVGSGEVCPEHLKLKTFLRQLPRRKFELS